MFEFIFGLFVFIIIVVIITKLFSTRRHPLKNDPIPEQLGIHIEGGLSIVQALHNTLSSSYVDNVKYRVLKEHSKWADHEFDWAFFELKRYFIMNSLLKSVPMFSPRVDDIWHEMLMFTREYETFSKGFFHDKLHHTPNMDSTPIPGERAFFDWVYLSLFDSTPNSRAIWGNFLQNPIKREILDDIKKRSEDELLRTYFRNNDEWLDVKKKLILKMKNEIMQSELIKQGEKSYDAPRSASEAQMYQFAVGAAVFYSLYEDDQFQEHMSEVIPNEYYKAGHNGGGGSSCSGFACSSNDHGSGGDSGGSSCSSCGGGCSS